MRGPKFAMVGARLAPWWRTLFRPMLSDLGALMTICGPYCRNVKYFIIFHVLTPEISKGLWGP